MNEMERSRFEKGDTVIGRDGETYEVVDKIGEGRCAIVYHAKNISHGQHEVALKVYNSGRRYEGALHREMSVLDTLQSHEESSNAVHWYGHFEYMGHHCLVLELLDCSVRNVLFKNNKQGLSPWGIQKFAQDVFRGLSVLHSEGLVHADLKPANIHWCSQHGHYKLLDFGLSFHTSEEEVHQVQSTGYQAPEVQEWNRFKQRKSSSISNNSGRKRTKAGNGCGCLTSCSNSSSSFYLHDIPVGGQFSPTSEQNLSKSSQFELTKQTCGTCGMATNHNFSLPVGNESPISATLSMNGSVINGYGVAGDPQKPAAPGKSIDIWSVGSILMEIATGRKLSKDVPLQCNDFKSEENKGHRDCTIHKLVDTQLAASFKTHQGGLDVAATYEILRDLIHRCMECHSAVRLTADEALGHPFLQLQIEPSVCDALLLPTRALRLTNIIDESLLENRHACEEIIRVLVQECEKQGPVVDSFFSRTGGLKGSAFILHRWAQDCCRSFQLLTGRTFNSRTIVATYYPLDLYPKQSC